MILTLISYDYGFACGDWSVAVDRGDSGIVFGGRHLVQQDQVIETRESVKEFEHATGRVLVAADVPVLAMREGTTDAPIRSRALGGTANSRGVSGEHRKESEIRWKRENKEHLARYMRDYRAKVKAGEQTARALGVDRKHVMLIALNRITRACEARARGEQIDKRELDLRFQFNALLREEKEKRRAKRLIVNVDQKQ